MNDRIVRFLKEGDKAHDYPGFSVGGRSFLGSSVLIAHRPGVSETILYNHLITSAIEENSVILFPLSEPYNFPQNQQPIKIDEKQLGERKKFIGGKIYQFNFSLAKNDKEVTVFFRNILTKKQRKSSYTIIIDSLSLWFPTLENLIRLLLRESPLVKYSMWLHCPLTRIPPDLFSAFANVIVIWPTENELESLDKYFPAESIPLRGAYKSGDSKNRMLVFKSQPLDERGWSWNPFSPD